MQVTRLMTTAALVALLSGCVPPPAPQAPALGLFWQGAGDWSVNRFPIDGTFYCSATRGTFGPDFALNETPAGVVGWNVTDTTGRAAPGTVYPVTLRFLPGGELHYTAAVQAPTRLASLPADAATAAAFPRDVAASRSVEISSAVLGRFGEFGLSGSAEVLAQLDRCAHGAL
jgi:hypothetical protein